MKLLELLTAAKARIDTPQKWLKGSLCAVRTPDGTRPVSDLSQANCACSIGALCLESAAQAGTNDACQVLDLPLYQSALKTLDACVPLSATGFQPSVARFNDAPGTSHAHVMAMFDRAIEMAKGQS